MRLAVNQNINSKVKLNKNKSNFVFELIKNPFIKIYLVFK